MITGRELAAMTDDELASNVTDIQVYARVSPADKLRVVTAWQERGAVVAMTGDGVNDAPRTEEVGHRGGHGHLRYRRLKGSRRNDPP